jgi:enoyl-CoA hydratase/carnithine racemase
MSATAHAEAVTASLIERSCADGVLTLTLANPPANALSMALIGELHAAIDAAADDPAARVVLIAANGHIFSGGHDLKEIAAHRRNDADGGRAWATELFERCSAMMLAIARSPRAIIAAVDGIATAGGCQLAAACDLAMASERARFCTPGVNNGGFCTTPHVALVRAIGRRNAMEMALTGDLFSAADAHRFGLVSRVFASEDFGREAHAFAAQIASKSAEAIAQGKPAFYAQADMSLEDAYRFANPVMVEGMLSTASGKGMAAFAKKKKAEWR